MILSYRNAVTEEIAFGVQSKRALKLLPKHLHAKTKSRLAALGAATSLNDLKIPGWNLEKLKGDRKDQYSIRINDQYRICFCWISKNANFVEIVDYH